MEVIYLITAKQKNKLETLPMPFSMYATTKKKKKKKKKRRKKETTRAWEMGVGSSMDSDLSHE